MTVFGFAVALTVILYGIYRLYMRYAKKRCTCKTDLTGKTVIITGSDKGECVYLCIVVVISIK